MATLLPDTILSEIQPNVASFGTEPIFKRKKGLVFMERETI